MYKTEKVICDTFLELLNEKPYNKITVRDIVERSHISRNTFYYHFLDIQDLLEKIVTEIVDSFFESSQNYDSIKDCLMTITGFMLQQKKVNLNIYHFADKEMLIKGLDSICRHAAKEYFKLYTDTLETRSGKELSLSHEQETAMVHFIHSIFLGAVIDWLNSNMELNMEKLIENVISASRVCWSLTGGEGFSW